MNCLKKGRAGFTSISLALFIFIFAYWKITYTVDWEGYEYLFAHPDESRDYMQAVISQYMGDNGFSYQDFFKLHILLISICYVKLFSDLKANPLFFVLLLLSCNYVAIGNQIRFFVSFPLAFIALHQYINKRYILFLLFGSLSIAFHYSIIILFITFLIFYHLFSKRSIFSQILYVIGGSLLISLLIRSGFYIQEQYLSYFSHSYISSILGGLLTMLPSLISFFLVWCMHYRVRQNVPQVLCNQQYLFLFTSSVCTSVLVFLGFSMQIFVSRFMTPMLPLWIIYMLKSGQLSGSLSVKWQAVFSIVVIIAVFLASRYIIPFVLGIYPEYTNEMMLMIKSYK